MHKTDGDRPSESSPNFTLILILKAFDLAVQELAQIKGVSYGDQRNQFLLQASLSQPDHPPAGGWKFPPQR